MPATTARRVAIEEAALELFAEQGYAATGIRDIARRAGVVSSGMYHYVGSKDELLAAIMRRGLTASTAAARASLELADTPQARLAVLVQTHVLLQLRDPRTANVIDGEVQHLTGALRAEIVGLRDAYEALWRRILDAGVRSGAFEVSDRKLARLALLEMCNGASRWYRRDARSGATDVAVAFADLALAAVRTTVAGRRVGVHDLPLPPVAAIAEIVARA